MNKKDIPLVVFLVTLLIAWPYLYGRFFAPHPPVPPEQPAPEPASAAGQEAALDSAPSEIEDQTEELPAAPLPEADDGVPEETITLATDAMKLELSSKGGSIKGIDLLGYPATAAPDSGPVHLDFSGHHALAYAGVDGLAQSHTFSVKAGSDGRSAILEAAGRNGVRLRRTLQVQDNYRLLITDEFTNQGTQPVQLSEHELQLGSMRYLESEHAVKGMAFLGVDALLLGGRGVEHYGKKLPKWFARTGGGVSSKRMDTPADWVSAKNKFFVQILAPSGGMEDFIIHAESAEDGKDIRAVSAGAILSGVTLAPGEPFTRQFTFYAGPKKYSELNRYGLHQAEVMEFFLRPVAKALLITMNFIHDRLWPHNYGLAIMLLTILVRVLFWPLTHKGTENMKRMAELQPMMKQIQDKYAAASGDSDKIRREKAQKKQQALMALYREHKVNPMMGCLPMIIQIPVFIALFYVLRSAIELRFAEFLWVKDLSEPENLLADVLPLPLNILPLLMAGTTVIQQKLTPTAGDPSQQKIMMFMPFIMLIFLYNFASGLVLYWTTNNVLMIVQQLLQRRKRAQKAVATA